MIIITDLYLIKLRSMPPTCMHRQFLLIVALYIWVAKLISSSVTNKHNFLQRLLHESDPLDQCNTFQYILAVKYRLSANYRINPSAYISFQFTALILIHLKIEIVFLSLFSLECIARDHMKGLETDARNEELITCTLPMHLMQWSGSNLWHTTETW